MGSMDFGTDGKYYMWLFGLIGDGTDPHEDTDMSVDGSGTPVTYKIVCPSGCYLLVKQLGIKLEDTGTFAVNTFGALTKLTTGMNLYWYRASRDAETCLTLQHPIRDNTDWGIYSVDWNMAEGLNPVSSGVVTSKYDFIDQSGIPLVMEPGDELRWKVVDDLSGLDSFHSRAGFVRIPAMYYRS